MGERRLSILLVDDDQVDQKAVVRYVKKQKLPYDLEVASSLVAARARMEERQFDLMLLDYLLPDGTGLDLLSETEIPAIILTGCGSELVAAEAMRRGAYDYLAKDSEHNYLLLMSHTIEHVLTRKRVQERLRQFERIADVSSDMIAILDRNYTYLAANPTYAKAFNKQYDEVVGHTISQVCGAKVFAEVVQPHALRCLAGETVSYQAWIDFPNGGRRFMDVRYDPDVSPTGEVVGFVVNARDITEHEQAEEQLLQEAIFRKSVIEKAAEGLCVCHEIKEFPYIRFTVWNKRMTEITGYTMEQINKKGWYQSLFPDPSAQARAMKHMEEMRQGKDITSEEWEITRADSEKRTVLFSTSVIMHADWQVEVLALLTDISERKQDENAYKMLVECTGEKIGQELFDAATSGLCAWVGLDCVIIGEVVEDGHRVRALGMSLDGKPIKGFTYDLEGTPCQNVAEQGLCEYPERIIELFPEDAILVEMGAEGYIGMPLRDSSGHTVGILCALSRKKLDLPANFRDVLQIIASRSAVEVARLKAEKYLQFKLDEISRMNQLMVGRELKMEELRKEISLLKREIATLRGE